jgi:hypothetical protein
MTTSALCPDEVATSGVLVFCRNKDYQETKAEILQQVHSEVGKPGMSVEKLRLD